MSYRNIAVQRLKPSEVIGYGRWAVLGKETRRCWLFTEKDAAARMLGSRCELIDLAGSDDAAFDILLSEIPDRDRCRR